MVKALALLSGGLDSILAAKLVKEQGIDITGVYFETPFQSGDGGKRLAEKNARAMGMPFEAIAVGQGYLRMISKPKHGYGSGMNPCIDCKMFMLKKAWSIAKKRGAKFLVTGEVVGQRPMSQQMHQLRLIDKETRLGGKILRPLSAKLLPPTEAEEKGWVDRERFLDISGRSRKAQMELADKYAMHDYLTPAGGCLLTDKPYSAKLKDAMKSAKLCERDCQLFKIGRHFRLGKNRIIVGRNESENNALLALKKRGELVFEVRGMGSPTTLLQGPKSMKAVKTAAALTARYSDSKEESVVVSYGRKRMLIKPASEKLVKELRIS